MARAVSVGLFCPHYIPFDVTPIDCRRTYAIRTQSIAVNSYFRCIPLRLKFSNETIPTIAIHCLTVNDKKYSYFILYLSPHMHRCPYKISLLLLDDPAGSDRKHYVWIKSLSHFIASKYTHAHARHVCMSCLQSFTSTGILRDHECYCYMHEP